VIPICTFKASPLLFPLGSTVKVRRRFGVDFVVLSVVLVDESIKVVDAVDLGAFGGRRLVARRLVVVSVVVAPGAAGRRRGGWSFFALRSIRWASRFRRARCSGVSRRSVASLAAFPWSNARRLAFVAFARWATWRRRACQPFTAAIARFPRKRPRASR